MLLDRLPELLSELLIQSRIAKKNANMHAMIQNGPTTPMIGMGAIRIAAISAAASFAYSTRKATILGRSA